MQTEVANLLYSLYFTPLVNRGNSKNWLIRQQSQKQELHAVERLFFAIV